VTLPCIATPTACTTTSRTRAKPRCGRCSPPSLVDVGAVRRVAAETLDAIGPPLTQRFVHGDLIPGNLPLGDLMARTLQRILEDR
jgi:hypothetical protein